jgi:hypothetical protein
MLFRMNDRRQTKGKAMSTTGKDLVHASLRDLRPLGAGGYTFDEMYRLAQVCQACGLFEDVKDASQAMIKIVKGQELGLPPLSAMAAIDIVAKRLFLKPFAMAAKINTCGYGGFRVTVQTPEICTIIFMRKYPGLGWQDCPPVSYTIEEATGQGLLTRGGIHWKSTPAHMLYQRCLGRGAAMYFPEVLMGLTASFDEAPVSEAQHASNVADLYGDQATAPPSLVLPSSAVPEGSPQTATEFEAALTAVWDAAGVPLAQRNTQRAQMVRRCSGTVPRDRYAAFLAEQRATWPCVETAVEESLDEETGEVVVPSEG